MADINIKLKVDAPDVLKLAEAILDLTVAIRHAGAPIPVNVNVASTTPAKAPAKAAAPIPAPAEIPVDDRESAIDPAPPTTAAPTIEDVRTAVRAFLQKKGKDETAKLLAKFGSPSVPALSPDKYAAVIAEASK